MYHAPGRPEKAPDRPTYVEIEFENGDAVAIDGETLSPAALLTKLNKLGGANGIGRLDLVENRYRRHEEPRRLRDTRRHDPDRGPSRRSSSMTLDRGAAHLKDELMPRYAELIYNGFWLAPEREMLQAMIDKVRRNVDGHGAAEALQGRVQRGRAQIAQIALPTRLSSPSRRTASITNATPKASSSSTRCACASPKMARG